MNDYLFSAIVIAAAFLVGWIVYFFIIILLKRWGHAIFRSKSSLGLIKNPLRYLIPAMSIAASIHLLRLPEKAHLSISHFVNILLIVLFGWVALKFVHILRDAILSRYNIEAQDNVYARGIHTQMHMIMNIINVIIVLLTVSFALMTFSGVRHIGLSILASAGILGIVIGFAAQKTLGNLIAGIQIAIAQPIRLDDVVIVENEWGWIEEITLTFVVVRIWDLRRLIVPVSYFLEKPFQNWTRTTADLLGTVFIYADYAVPIKEVRDELTRILENNPNWDKKVNLLQVTKMSEKTVELRALMSASSSSVLLDLRCQVREKLLEFLQQRFPESLPKTHIEMNKEGSSN